MTKNCIILSRVSTLQQDLTQQTEVVKQEAIRQGYDNDHIILIEDKESAVKLSEEERNGLNTLKYHIERGDVDCVIVYEISRISRQAKIVYSIRDYLVAHGVQLIIMNPYCKVLKEDNTLSETANILFGIFASMAENEGYIRKMRCKRGIQKLKAEGKYWGHALLFGYSVNDKKEYILHPEQSKLVIEIFERYVNEHVSISTLTKQLYDEGKFGDIKLETYRWHVVNILKRTEYIGESFYPRIVSNELFYAARAKAERNTKWNKETRKNGLIPSLLRGVMHEEESNATFTLVKQKIGDQYKAQLFDGVKACISAKIIEPLVWHWCVELHKKYNNGDKSKLLQSLRNDRDRIYTKIDNLRTKINKCNDKIDKIEERWIDGKISSDKRDTMREVVEAELNSLKEQKTTFEKELATKQMQIHKQRSTKLNYDNLSFDEQRSLILETIKTITIASISTTHNKYKKRIRVYNNYDDHYDEYICDAGKFIRSRDPFKTIVEE